MCVFANVVPVSDVIYSALTHVANCAYSKVSGSLDVTVLKREAFIAYLSRSCLLPLEAPWAAVVVTLWWLTRVISFSDVHDYSPADVAKQICSITNQKSTGLASFRGSFEVKRMNLAASFALFENSMHLSDMIMNWRTLRFLELLLSLSNFLL